MGNSFVDAGLNRVRSAIAGYAGQKVSAYADEVRGLVGLSKEGNNSGLTPNPNVARTGNKSILTYPMNVDNDPQQGHHMLFHIYTRENGAILSPKVKKTFEEFGSELDSEFQSIRNEYHAGVAASYNLGQVVGDANNENDPNFAARPNIAYDSGIPKVKSASGGTNRSIVYSTLPTKKLETSIALYMPPSVQVNYDVKYVETEIGNIAIAGADAIAAFRGASGQDLTTKIESAMRGMGPAGKEALQAFLNKTLDTAASGAAALINLERGTVITPRMEMMFQGVGRRSFSYTFNFIPKSEAEAKLVEEIITQFKFYMMPRYSNPRTRREMDIPGFFQIEYMYHTQENNFINKIKPSFLTGMQVQYGGDRFTAYEQTDSRFGTGSPPQKSQLTLNFSELETLSQESVGEGY